MAIAYTIITLYLGAAIVLILAALLFLRFFNQRLVENEPEKKYRVEFVKGRYAVIKKKRYKRMKF